MHLLMPLLAAFAVQAPPCGVSVHRTGHVHDAETQLPVGDAVVSSSLQRVRTAGDGRFTIRADRCDSLHVRRLGYRTVAVPPGAADTLRIALRRVPVPVAGVETRASAGPAAATVTVEAADARVLGGTTAADLAAAMPLVGVRTVSGRTTLSLRGSRAEQVLVTLDGMPLNDPATGVADIADIPLVALGHASATLGGGAAAHGSGAAGGVLALTSGTGSVVAAQAGSYGNHSVEGAWTVAGSRGRARIGGALAGARNDFAFRNVAAAAPADTVERRVNNDMRRVSGFGSLVGERFQLLVLHSATERGLVGPMNVRAFDRDRGRTARTLARALTSAGGMEVQASARLLGARYDNPSRSDAAFTVGARSFDMEAARPVRAVALRGGGGVDVVEGSTLRRSARARGFLAGALRHEAGPLSALLAVRGDAVDGVGARFTPSLTLRRAGTVALTARIAQGFRVPTFYDVYFATPQRITANVLRPEHVRLDAELRATVDRTCGGSCTVRAEVTGFERRTSQAIVWFPGNVGWSPQNVPLERARGAELHLSGGTAGVRATTWGGRYLTRLWDGYLEMRTPYVPYWSGGAALSGSRGGFTGRLQVQHTGRRPFVNGPPLPELELPPATTGTAGLQHVRSTPLGAVTVSLSVDDAWNARPELVRRYPAPGREWAVGISLAP